MFKKISFVFFSLLLVSLSMQAERVKNFSEIGERIRKLDPETTLVVFDVDYTLTQPSDPVLQIRTIAPHLRVLMREIASLEPREADLFFSLLVSETDSIFTEPEVPELLEELEESGYRTVALTGLLTGPIGDHGPGTEWRIAELRKLGVDLSWSFPKLPPRSFDDLDTGQVHPAMWSHGVLFTNGEHSSVSKGDLLLAFLRWVEWTPKTILFVDDREHNVQEVKVALEYSGSEVIALRYDGPEFIPEIYLSEEVVVARWRKIIEYAKRQALLRSVR